MHYRSVLTFCKTSISSFTHVQVPYKDDYQCIFKGIIDGAGVGDVQYASVSLLEGTRGGANVMLDLAGDHCEPPSDDELKVGWMDDCWLGGWLNSRLVDWLDD